VRRLRSAFVGALLLPMTICREPHAIAATPDGRWGYVPCRDGHDRVVDAGAGSKHNLVIDRARARRGPE